MAKILIVDDELDIVCVIRELLIAHHHDARGARNGLAALQQFQTQFFDLIITDLQMPCMDGLSFLHEVKQLEPEMPVIVLTGFASLTEAIGTMDKNAFTCLSKPFDNSELITAVESLLRRVKK